VDLARDRCVTAGATELDRRGRWAPTICSVQLAVDAGVSGCSSLRRQTGTGGRSRVEVNVSGVTTGRLRWDMPIARPNPALERATMPIRDPSAIRRAM